MFELNVSKKVSLSIDRNEARGVWRNGESRAHGMMCSCSITGSTADLKGIMRSSFADGSFHLAVAVHQSFFFAMDRKSSPLNLRGESGFKVRVECAKAQLCALKSGGPWAKSRASGGLLAQHPASSCYPPVSTSFCLTIFQLLARLRTWRPCASGYPQLWCH